MFSLKKNGKVPRYVLDGMTSDVDGNLFITTFGGNKVIKIYPKLVHYSIHHVNFTLNKKSSKYSVNIIICL